MALWIMFVLILLSASFVFVLSVGPLKAAPNAGTLRWISYAQFVAAAVLAVARLTGNA